MATGPNPNSSGLGADSFDRWRDHLDTETRSETSPSGTSARLAVPALTVLWHPRARRAGERVIFPQLAADVPGDDVPGDDVPGDDRTVVEIGRQVPAFAPVEGGAARPLADPRLSRRPIRLRADGSGLCLDPTGSRTTVVRWTADGARRRLEEPTVFADDELRRGVVLVLAERVALLLHLQDPTVQSPPSFGLVGESSAMVHLRRRIARVAELEVPVLVLGESGTGKELVASALGQASPRQGPFVALNMGAIPPSLAASELFGAAKGAYSGADQRRPGFFRRADGGTLFLDEIGEAPPDVQVLLLRALESGEIQPVGADRPSKVDVRVIAATDADLEAAVAEGRFRAPLFHRLSSYVVRLPPLRERRDDLGRLFLHFLRQELRAVEREHLLVDSGPQGRPWVPASLVARLAAHDWRGNVRELRNGVRQLVVACRDEDEASLGPDLEASLRGPIRDQLGDDHGDDLGNESTVIDPPVPTTKKREAKKTYRDPTEVSEDELVEALRAHRWQPKPAAEALGLSRASLYALMERSPRVRKASDLGADEIEAARERCAGDLEEMVEALQVSKQGLKMRMGELGLR